MFWKMNYFFSFLEGGGGVCNIAFTTSSNLSGCRLIFASFDFGCFRFRAFTSFLNQNGPQFSCEPVPSNALFVGEPLSFRHLNRNFHALPVIDAAIVPTKFKLSGVAVKVFTADVVKRTHHTALQQAEETFRRVRASERAVCIFARAFVCGVVHNVRLFSVP
jgi:hypothetical protein